MKAGDSIGPYRVVSELGVGGMGEVYRAHDTRLGRDVALKSLPDAVAGDPDRLMRFEREAKSLAALNHPNIAQVYGIEDSDGAPVIAMELVQGRGLDEIIAGAGLSAPGSRGLPLEDVRAIALQIAGALEAAHESGIVHRDLKPANVKVTDDGTVKVLDFGLAKALDAGPGTPDRGSGASAASNTPTVTSPALTAMGMVLGTAAYMSPEQARGRPVDRRADIWAFGCVLYEMLTGRRPFEGEDVSITLANVLKDDVDWDALPADLPPSVRRVLRRCLEKDPRRRLSAIGDARLELEERDAVPSAVTAPAATRSTFRPIAALLATALVAALVTIWVSGLFRPEAGSVERLTVLASPGMSIAEDTANVAISPDGRRLAFLAGTSAGDTRLWLRDLDDLVPREVQDSVGATLPFWSPDSRRVGFFVDGQLMTVSAAGGRPQRIAEAPDARGGTWNADGTIVFAPTGAGPLARLSENGGAVAEATVLQAGETGHRFPSFLPDGRHFLFAVLPASAGQFEIHVGSLDSADREVVVVAESSPVYAAPGFLVYTRRGVLLAHPFDASRGALTGEAVPLGDTPAEMNVRYAAGWAVSASDSGSVAYLSAARSRSRVAWLDGTGREVEVTAVPPGPYINVSVSRDGRVAALTQLAAPTSNIWLADLERGGLTPMTSEAAGWNGLPVLSPDGRRVAFSSDRNGTTDLFTYALDAGSTDTLYESPGLFKHVWSWSAGGVITFSDLSSATADDLWTLNDDGGDTPRAFLQSSGRDSFGAVSPDGRWMAYISDAAGLANVYVQAFPGPGVPRQITTAGTLPWGLWWHENGRQLLVIDAEHRLLRVDVQTTPALSSGTPRVVGRLPFPPVNSSSIDAMPDLQRLLAIVPEQVSAGRSLTVLRHWQETVGARTP